MNVQVNSNFKKMTSKAIFSIVLFVFVYLLLVLAAIGLTALCFVGGIALIILKPMWLTICVGLGIASVGLLVLIFLLKFIFKKHKVDRTGLVEITRKQEPKLFKLIDEIVHEVQTDFPKKVFVSSDVNAFVFYDSSFWSMFLPIKKNLNIGIGLVNAVTEQELKAILAHEFGHFSQKSMKVGSYVYNVNGIIYNLLFDNQSFDKMVATWADLSDYFAFFVYLAVKITLGIQWILRKMYGVVNLSYKALSREMEFHADEVAAHVAGSTALKESLLRLDLAAHSYNSAVNYYYNRVAENKISPNIFTEQRFIMQYSAQKDGLAVVNELPNVTLADVNKYNKSKLYIKDQWASHPSTEERIDALDRLNIHKNHNQNGSARTVFMDIISTEKLFTDKLFEPVEYSDAVSELSLDEFETNYKLMLQKYAFDEMYNEYYDNKNPSDFDFETDISSQSEVIPLQQLYSKENVDLVYEQIALTNDIATLKQIAAKQTDIKTFEYNGIKYKDKEALKLVAELETYLNQLNATILENDKRVCNFFYHLAQSKNLAQEYKEKYQYFISIDKQYDEWYEIYVNFNHSCDFTQQRVSYEEIEKLFVKVKQLEPGFKDILRAVLETEIFAKELSDYMLENINTYLESNYSYFSTTYGYQNNELQIMFDAMGQFYHALSQGYFNVKKDLLTWQAELCKN